jgi:FMN phosphatase YigB (HAD superfamily)
MLKKYVIAVLLLFSCLSHAEIVIWDLGDVLFKQGKWGIARHIGLFTIADYIVRDLQLPWITVKPILFDIFSSLETPQEKLTDRAPMHDGSRMPLIVCQWQAGLKTGAELIELLQKKVEELANKGYFVSGREKKVIWSSIQAMFDPAVLGQYTYALPDGIRLLHECATARDATGKKKHTMAILSNWDRESFLITRARHSDIFSYFHESHIVISGTCGFYKPQEDIFTYCLKRLGAQPHECIFIDDQKVNTDAAQRLGMRALQLVNKNYTHLRAELVRMGILS